MRSEYNICVLQTNINSTYSDAVMWFKQNNCKAGMLVNVEVVILQIL